MPGKRRNQKKGGLPPRRPAGRRPLREPASVEPKTFTALVAAQLTTAEGPRPWATGHQLEPLPADMHELLEAASPTMTTGMAELQSGGRTLQGAIGLAYNLVGFTGDENGKMLAPDWLRAQDIPVDVLDLLFYGCAYPQQLADATEFGHARDLWLDHLSKGPAGEDLARLIAAAVDVADELDEPVDSPAAWLGTLTRMAQCGIGTRPLANASLPARVLAGTRLVPLEPLHPDPTDRPADTARAAALVSYLGSDTARGNTVEGVLRCGLAILTAAVLEEQATLEQLATATGPLYVDDVDDRPTRGTMEAVEAAEDAEMTLNETLALLDHPAATVAAHRDEDVRAAVDAFPGRLLLGALRLGLAPQQPRGTELRHAVPWAVGLLPGSALEPAVSLLVDALLTPDAPTGLRLLAQVCALPGLDAEVGEEDRAWRGEPGSALVRFATAAGVTQVATSTYRVVVGDQLAAATLEAQRERFVRRFGREPRPDDPWFFDPDADEPHPLPLESVGEGFAQFYRSAGVSELMVRASAATRLAAPAGGQFADARRQEEWEDAVAVAATELGMSEQEAAETAERDYRTLDGVSLMMMIRQMTEDDAFARGALAGLRDLVDRLDPDDDIEVASGPGYESTLPAWMLRWHPEILTFARDRPGWDVAAAAATARRWADLDLARQVQHLGALIEQVPHGQRAEDSLYGWEQVPAAAVLLAVATGS